MKYLLTLLMVALLATTVASVATAEHGPSNPYVDGFTVQRPR